LCRLPNLQEASTVPVSFVGPEANEKSLALLASTYVHSDYQYVEPFAGSAALFFSLQPASAVLGDLNGHLSGGGIKG